MVKKKGKVQKMNRKERKNLARLCNAKDVVCKVCTKRELDDCKLCPIVNIIDIELHCAAKRSRALFPTFVDDYSTISLDGIPGVEVK